MQFVWRELPKLSDVAPRRDIVFPTFMDDVCAANQQVVYGADAIDAFAGVRQ